MNEIRWLNELTRDDLPVAGGKGANLGELVRAGFPVPDGFVVTTAGYDRMTAELADAVCAAYRRLGGGAVAVRSSATAEDLAEASFAGQQDTYLNVNGEHDLLRAIEDCWASLWTDRAVRYRAEHGVSDDGLALAVVVQRLVPADAAGVMFTANPANGRTEETVITAAWGLGEAVVSGLVDTDTITVDTTTKRIIGNQVADKVLRIDPQDDRSGERTFTRSTTQAERHAAVLSDAEALRLAELGSAIERHFGKPQDIEWVRAGGEFSIVQARPITALPPRTGPVPQDWPMPARGLYFRASITEQLPDPLSPLFADLMADAVPTALNRLMDELMGAPDADIGFPTINGYAFYRYGYSAFGAMLKASPGAVRTLFRNGGRWVEDRWRGRSLVEYSDAVQAQRAHDPQQATAAELLAGITRMVDEMAYYYTAVQTIIPLAAVAELSWTAVYEKLLRKPGEPGAQDFLLGSDSEPIRAEKALFDLAAWAAAQPGLKAALTSADVDLLESRAPDGVSDATWGQWAHRFGDYLEAHGHVLYNLDFVNPVAADDPAPIVQTLRFYLSHDAEGPYQRQRELVANRDEATAALLARLSDPLRRRVAQLLNWAQRLGPLREDALAAMGLGWPTARRLLRELGGRLVAAGALDEAMDLCWLDLAEVRRCVTAVDGHAEIPVGLQDRIAERQAVARGQRQVSPPQYLPKNKLMDAFEWMYPATRTSDDKAVLSGTGGSGGVVTARARVLSGPEDFSTFEAGEVLVASITTPAYTPLFAIASGVVTDIGGVLSHGSIVAREYAIPAVLGTGNATRTIHSGDEITVDGNTGKVFLANSADAQAPVVEPRTNTRKRLLIGAGLLAGALIVRRLVHRQD